jgi:signal transduction histidine kinase
MYNLDRYYPYFREAPLPFVEALLLPWQAKDGLVGTLWIVAHSDRRKFDREDVRLMGCLSAFASGAIRLKHTLVQAERAIATVEVVAAMAHCINNPLQGAILALYNARSTHDPSPGVREMILMAERELERVVALSADVIRKAIQPI